MSTGRVVHSVGGVRSLSRQWSSASPCWWQRAAATAGRHRRPRHPTIRWRPPPIASRLPRTASVPRRTGWCRRTPTSVGRPRVMSTRSIATAICSRTPPRRWATCRRWGPTSSNHKLRVTTAADAVETAKTDLATAQQELVDAQAALAEAIATASSVPNTTAWRRRARPRRSCPRPPSHGSSRPRTISRARRPASPPRPRWSRPAPPTTRPPWQYRFRGCCC